MFNTWEKNKMNYNYEVIEIKRIDVFWLRGLIQFRVVVEDRMPNVPEAIGKYKTQVSINFFKWCFHVVVRSAHTPYMRINNKEDGELLSYEKERQNETVGPKEALEHIDSFMNMLKGEQK